MVRHTLRYISILCFPSVYVSQIGLQSAASAWLDDFTLAQNSTTATPTIVGCNYEKGTIDAVMLNKSPKVIASVSSSVYSLC
jgi:hypothetical protein